MPALITGLGVVSPIGVGSEAFTRGLRAGRSGVRLLDFANSHMKSTVGAVCAEFRAETVFDAADLERLPRIAPMAVAAAGEALDRAGLGREVREEIGQSRRIGLILGTGGGGIEFVLDQAEKVHKGGRASLWTITNATHGNMAGELSIRLGLRGPSWCTSTGCASSSDALGTALLMLRAKEAGVSEMLPETWVVVGADSHVCWGVLYPMELLRVISTRDFAESPQDAVTASRPFDRTRDGFVLGEGAWAVVVESEATAKRRAASQGRTLDDLQLASVLGYGATCDAYHRVRPAPDMEEAARAMRLAMADAGLTPGEIELIHYHGTGTQLNDALETAAVKMAFGEHAGTLRGTSVKSMIGHPQGASGLAALAATMCGLRPADGGPAFIPPTINLREPDPACDLDYTPNVAATLDAPESGGRGARGGPVVELSPAGRGRRRALINCLAFGAKNSALVIEG